MIFSGRVTGEIDMSVKSFFKKEFVCGVLCCFFLTLGYAKCVVIQIYHNEEPAQGVALHVGQNPFYKRMFMSPIVRDLNGSSFRKVLDVKGETKVRLTGKDGFAFYLKRDLLPIRIVFSLDDVTTEYVINGETPVTNSYEKWNDPQRKVKHTPYFVVDYFSWKNGTSDFHVRQVNAEEEIDLCEKLCLSGSEMTPRLRKHPALSQEETLPPVTVKPFISDAPYLVVNLSGGPDAAEYPVSRLDEPPSDGWTDIHKGNLLVLRRIAPGSFMMGSPLNELGRPASRLGLREEPLHDVTLTQSFYMGVFEVTQRQWRLVTGMDPAYFKGDFRPVEYVSYSMIRGKNKGALWPESATVDADSFLGKLRHKTGIRFDLPTEAQWEYACRAGSVTALNSGENLTATAAPCPNMVKVGRYRHNRGDGQGEGFSEHTTVGSYEPNAWGLYDMHGNVQEWCLDWWRWDEIDRTAVTDPKGVPSETLTGLVPQRITRGGCYYYDAPACRSASRNSYPSFYTYTVTGFRISAPASFNAAE